MSLFELIASWSPLTFASIGLAIGLLDIFLIASSFLMWIGCSFLYMALFAALGASGEVLLMVFAIGTILNLVFLRSFMIHTSNKADLVPRVGDLVGCNGTILSVSKENPTTGRAVIVGHGEWRIRDKNSEPLIPHSRITVVNREAMLLITTSETTNTTKQ